MHALRPALEADLSTSSDERDREPDNEGEAKHAIELFLVKMPPFQRD
jgi:hypothetical protein